MVYVELRRIELHSETAALERAVAISFEKNCKFLSIVRKYLRGNTPLHVGNRHLNAMEDAESLGKSLWIDAACTSALTVGVLSVRDAAFCAK